MAHLILTLQFSVAQLAEFDIGLSSLLRFLLERMQYMNSVTPADYVENPECATRVLDSDFPNAAADTCERFAVQRLFTSL